MKIDEKLIESIIQDIKNISYIKTDDFPTIDLYMDQVTSFIEGKLSTNKRFEEDKILTKTMINNYAKNHLFPSPIKKKYTRDHLIIFSIIYYLKSFLSINDIKKILLGMQDDTDLIRLYSDIVASIKKNISHSTNDILNTLKMSYENEKSDSEAIYLFISQLSYDIYIRKQIIERLLDHTHTDEKKPNN